MNFRLLRFLLITSCCELAGFASGQSAADRVPKSPSANASESTKPPLQAESQHDAGLSGRLFFSREQRERLDLARMRGDVTGVADQSEAPSSTVNGFVMRSDGTTTVWVDGSAKYGVAHEKIRALQPSDIGGSSEKIRVVLRDEAPKAATKLRTKPVARKASRPKPAARR